MFGAEDNEDAARGGWVSLPIKTRQEFETLRQKIRSALDDFCQKDRDLLDRDASERSITHKIAEHIQIYFQEYNVDCEYNRQGENVKRLGLEGLSNEISRADATDAVTVFPDIIVHKRGEQTNLLVIEAKKTNSNHDYSHDLKKLTAFTALNSFAYRFGLLLIIDTEKSSVRMDKWFHHGKEFSLEVAE